MIVEIFNQPDSPLGIELSNQLASNNKYKKVCIVSAFARLRTLLRFREDILKKQDQGANVFVTLGIDLGGTSIEVLRELLDWKCHSKIIHNKIPFSTFHPKIYLFEGEKNATLYIGSNNFTDGGMYSNYEAYTRFSFDFPNDQAAYEQKISPLERFIFPDKSSSKPLSQKLLESLFNSKLVPSETVQRQSKIRRSLLTGDAKLFANLPYFPPPSLPSKNLESERDAMTTPVTKVVGDKRDTSSLGKLLWKKKLSKSDSSQTKSGSNAVGGVRLTQAKFKDESGKIIDQTQYFYDLFYSSGWENEFGHTDAKKVHTFISARIIIRNKDYGIRNFEVSHKPTGEAGQGNYTTILRWGKAFAPIIVKEKIANLYLNLHEAEEIDATYLIVIE